VTRLVPDVFGGATDAKGRQMHVTGPIDRPHYGSAEATASTDEAVWKRLTHEWYGLTPVRGMNWCYWAYCPHWIIGKRCPTLQRRTGDYIYHDKHHCRNTWRHDHNPLLWDHARAWRNAAGELVITLEPWGNPYDYAPSFHALERDLDALGIVTCFEGRSPYGATYIMFLMADDTDAGRRARRVQQVAREFRQPIAHCHNTFAV